MANLFIRQHTCADRDRAMQHGRMDKITKSGKSKKVSRKMWHLNWHWTMRSCLQLDNVLTWKLEDLFILTVDRSLKIIFADFSLYDFLT